MKAVTILYFAVGALALSRRQDPCTANGEDCSESACCTDTDYECKPTVDLTGGSLLGNTCQLKSNIAPVCVPLLKPCGLDIDGNEINLLGCCEGTSCLPDPSGGLFTRGDLVPKSCQADDTSSGSTTTDDSATSTTASATDATDSATTTTDSASTTTGTCDAGAGSCSKNSDCCSNDCQGLLEPLLEPILNPITGELTEPVENLLGTCVPVMTSTTATDSATTTTDEATMTTTTDAAATTPANCEVEAKPCNYDDECCSYECIPNEHAPVYFRRGGEHEYFSGTCKPYHPIEAPIYPTETSYSKCPYPSTYPVHSTEYATTIVYEHSTATVTVCPTAKPEPTYPAKETAYTTVYVTYLPITKTEPAPTTYATVSTVTVTVQPSKTACPSKATSPAAPADTHPAQAPAPSAPAAPANSAPAASPAAPGAVQQIADGQVQSPAGGANASPVQQIADGQIQNPAAPASPAAPSYGGKASNGTASPSAPQAYTGAAGKQIASFGAVVLGAVVAAL